METLSGRDLQIFREKSRAFCGSVKIPLDKLRGEELPHNPRQFDEKNVTRLLDIFNKDDCQRREPDNHVPVLIPRSALPEGPLRVGVDLQLFNPDYPLTYLHGRHRLEAARKFLSGNDRWWVADLYSDDLSLQVKSILREHDPNCAKFYDGDVLRQIRISTLRGDTARRDKWLARLSKSKQNSVKRLEALPEKFWDSLDALIPFAGLWPAFWIGTVPRLLNLHCPEELTRYLRRVKETLTYIIGENENDWLLIDPNTAHLLQGRCPGLSSEDRAFIQMRMLAGELFPAIRGDNIRTQIFERLCTIKHVIISIHTFLEDTKYLEPCSRILKKLLPSKCKGSLSEHYAALHSGQRNARVQTAEFTFEDRTLSVPPVSWLAYRMLWLCTLRHFPVMDGQAPRRDIGKRNSWQPGLQSRWWVELSALAQDNGYRRIRRLFRDRKAADVSMIEDCVRRILPSNYYVIDQGLMRRKAELIYEIIGDIPRVETVKGKPELTSDHENCRPDIADRCGRPRASALEADEGYLFIDYIYSTSYDTTPKRYLTSFAITRDFFHSFFGTAEDDLDYHGFRIPGGDPDGGREGRGRMQDIGGDTAADQPFELPPEAPLPSDATRAGEDLRTTLVPSAAPQRRRLRSLERRRGISWRNRSASPATRPRYSERRRERSVSQSERRLRRDSRSPSVEDTYGAATSSAGLLGASTSSAGDMETSLVPRVPQPLTSPELFVEDTHSALVPSVPLPPATPSLPENMFVFGQGLQNRTISIQEASRFLFRRRIRGKSRPFRVISPAGNGRFSISQADPTDPVSMVNALQLPSEVPFLTKEKGKRLKLTAPITILEEARSQRLDTALIVSQHSVRELIRRFEDCEGSEQELQHVDPHRVHTGMELVQYNAAKPIMISIWEDGEWKIEERNVTHNQTEERIRYFTSKYKSLRPYDFEGNSLSIEECFDAAQSDFPPTVYLSTPEQATSLFPIEL